MNDSDRVHGAAGWFGRLMQLLNREPATREDLFEVLDDARQRKLLDQDAMDTIQRVLQVSELRVRDVMVPRAQAVVLDRRQAPEEILPLVTESAHSRFPVTDGDKEKVAGILLAKDLLRYFHTERNGEFNWRDLLRPAVFIPESKRLNVLLKEFRASRNHMAIVVDEYGSFDGLVTIEDVLEQIVGEIEDEYDIDDEDSMVMQRGANDFVVKAVLPVEDFNERFECKFSDEDIDTVGGLVIGEFGHVPRRGEAVTIGDLRFEVLNADSRRVHLLKVTRRPA